MPNFQSLFREAKGHPIDYNGVQLVRYDKFPIQNGDTLICSIESAISSPQKIQGFCIDVTGYAEMNGRLLKQGKGVRLHFWENSSPPEFSLKIFSDTEFVWVYNVCEIETSYLISDENGKPLSKKSKTLSYGINGAAMIVEEIKGGRRYRCSDVSAAEKPFPFNDIVFTVKNLTNSL